MEIIKDFATSNPKAFWGLISTLILALSTIIAALIQRRGKKENNRDATITVTNVIKPSIKTETVTPSPPASIKKDILSIKEKIKPSLKIPDAYLRWVRERCKAIDLKNLIDKENVTFVGLPEIFIPLLCLPLEKKEKKTPDGLKREEALDIETVTGEGEYLLIEGQAGSGKTTLIKHLALTLANDEREDSLRGYLPILIFLRELSDFDWNRQKAGTKMWELIIEEYFGEQGLDRETILSFCHEGKALFLVDGLDEIDEEPQEKAVQSLSEFRVKHGGKVLLTGRPHSMKGEVLNRFGDRHTSINPLTMPQVEFFIRKWYQTIMKEKTGLEKKSADNMLADVRSHENIGNLIGSPLMLTAVCILYHGQGRKLPEQRAELYEKFVDNLLSRRFEGKEADAVGKYLMELASKMHKDRQKMVDRIYAVNTLGELLDIPEGETVVSMREEIEEKFSRIEESCGLLKREKGQYKFWHLSFQEFLAARNVVRKGRKYDEDIQDFWEDDWYREVILLCIGYLGIDNSGWANGIVEEELKKEGNVSSKHRLLAAASLIDLKEGTREKKVVEKAKNTMIEIYQSPLNDAALKAEAGEIIGRLGDTRDLKVFIKIKGGECDLEGLKTKKIDSFAIGKYPVTNLWFRKFIDGGGYKDESYWSGEGKKWLRAVKVAEPRFWWQNRWNCPNSPVVGVSWYEADAFCRWLTAMKQDGHTYRLPSEEEWQAAAAGLKEKRKYPWGNWKKNRANIGEAGIRKTSSVGIFLEGATQGKEENKIFDLSGNVWEWTCSGYRTQKRLPDFTFDNETQKLYDQRKFSDAWDKYEKKGFPFPVLRGGSLKNYSAYARCDFRGRYDPNDRDNDVGFRCAKTL